MCGCPMTMTFNTALKIYPTAVHNQFPQGPNSRNARRGIAQVKQGGGQGRGGGGRGGRGGGRGSQQQRCHNPTNGRNHPDSETIVLTNGSQIQYHPSYNFTDNELRNMTNGQRERLQNERRAYCQQMNSNQDRDARIAEMEATIASLTANRSSAEIPEQVVPQDQQTQVSRITTGTRGSVYGGRNRQQRRREQGADQDGSVSKVTVLSCTIASANNLAGSTQEPRPGTVACVEWDSNADTCCLGANFIVLSYTQRIAEVYPYNPTLPSVKVPIVSGATAYDCPDTGETFVFVVNEGLYYSTKLDHSLFNQMQIRGHGIPVWDNPYDQEWPLGMEIPQVFVPFHTNGIKVQFKTRAPTAHELENCLHINLTSRTPWNPQEITISETNTRENGILGEIVDNPRGNEHELRSLDLLLDPSQWRVISQTETYDPRSLDVPTRATFKSSERHERVNPQGLSKRWGISVQRARATMKATLQRGRRSALLPLARRYRADCMYERPLLKGKFSTDTAYFKCKSLNGNIVSQIFFHKCGFYANYNLPKVDDVNIGPTLAQFISEYGIPEHLTMDGAAVQKGRKTKFMETIKQAAIKHHILGPYRPEQNPAEGGI